MEVQGSTEYRVPKQLPRVCFRAYDIRGPVDADNITPDLAYAIGLAVGAEAKLKNQHKIVVGRDGRLSGPCLTQALVAGLMASGLEVIFIGIVPTPVLYFATYHLNVPSGVMVTASHNPGSHNGFKIVLAGKTLTASDIDGLYESIQQRRFSFGKGGLQNQSVDDDYVKCIVERIHIARPLRIVLDCGNGVAGDLAPRLFGALGCEVIPLYCDIDGHFPNHHPDPTVPENLQDLISKVVETQADIGFAFDGDADRLGVVDNLGQIIWPDRQMMLFALEILENFPGAEIIFDVKCSRNLAKIITEHGGRPIMWRTGHSMIKAKLFEQNSPFAGELSGHIFFRDTWFGFDDGMYVGARLLQILARGQQSASELFATLPNSINTPELKLPLAEEKKFAFMQKLVDQSDFPGAEIITIDGLRIEYLDGWALIRPSNTSPYIIIRFEADTEEALRRIMNEVRQQLLRIDADLKLPF